MSQTELLTEPKDLWRELVDAEANAGSSQRAFLNQCAVTRIDSIRRGLDAAGAQRLTALRLIPLLPLSDRQELFPDLVRFASWAHGLIQRFRDLVLALPRDWVIANIERAAEPLLENSSETYQFEEYRRLLELYTQLGDCGLIERLANRAISHSDEDVREAGQDSLLRLKSA